MKHLYSLSLLLLALLLPATASAYNFEVNGIYYLSNGHQATVTYSSSSDNKYTGDVTIPASVTYDGTTYSVTYIGDYAFYDCSGLTSVTIPNSVISIGNYAFYDCSGLTSINIPNSITFIGDFAFYSCSGLTSITIPNSVTSIGKRAFIGCCGLTSISVAGNNPKYDSRGYCNAIIETVTNTLIVGCQNTTIPNSVTFIEDFAFSHCTGLTSVSIPNSVTSIGEWAFSYCCGLTCVDAGESKISTIPESAFYNCLSLSSVTLPYSLRTIANGAFYYCEKLDQMVCKAITPPTINEYNSIYPGYYMATLYVPMRSVEAYRATEFWNSFINIVGFETNDDIPHNSPQQKCDTNDDGEINISDVNRVIDAILGH